jgi:hypothetical protein
MSKKKLYEITAQHNCSDSWKIKTKIFAKNGEKAVKEFRKNYSGSFWLLKDIREVENAR